MAAVTYTVKRGDSLWAISASSEWGPKIAGNNINAKIATLRSLNGIPANSSLIYPNQVLILSGNGGGGSSSTSSSASADNGLPWDRVVIDILNIQADTTTGRDVYAHWNWRRSGERNSNSSTGWATKGYKVRWEYDTVINGQTVTQYNETTTSTPGDTFATFAIPDTARPYNNWVQVFVTPVSETYTTGEGENQQTVSCIQGALVEVGKQYFFKDNPPFTPDKPTCEVENTTLTMKIDEIKKEIDAARIVFQVVKDNTSVIHTSAQIPVVKVTDEYGKASAQCTVQLGSSYKVRAKAISWNGKESAWSDFSNEAETKPSAPTFKDNYRRNKYKEGDETKYSAYLEWNAVPNAVKYKIEYTTVRDYFDNPSASVSTVETTDAKTSITILGIDNGADYFFRVKAISKSDAESDPSQPIMIPIGEPPAAPTTRSSASYAFAGDPIELSWTHNSSDGSTQSLAEVSLKIGDADWISYIYQNTTDSSSIDPVVNSKWKYGQCVSVKGNMYFKMDTTLAEFKNKKVQWKVRTAGVTDEFSDSAWSVELPVYIYEKPTFEMSVTKDSLGTTGLIETLDSFPFFINAKAVFESPDYTLQKPVGYHTRIVSNEFYSTVDEAGVTKNINAGDAVFDRYIDTSDPLLLEISANDVNLESGVNYIIYCTLDMSTGLTLTAEHEFGVSWTDTVSYNIVVDIGVDKETYTARINPYCVDNETGGFVENITLSVYRREYDGKYTLVGSGIPNTNTSITDPHPALDYARYRIVAKDTVTGAISFYDAPGYPVKCSSVIIQWDEEWKSFDVTDNYSVEGPAWSGSFLELKYNVEVADNRAREVSVVRYAGRENPVAYYGTQISEAPSWSVSIPKEDKETIYALRRLSIWTGDVYIREPSGMGYWANVRVNFNQKFKDVTIPVTLNITKVEGGV